MRRPCFSTFTFLLTGLFLALFAAACGTKPDGTPYGTDPAKLPEGRQKKQSATSIYQKDVPKGAELNATTNSARAGQPASAQPPAPAAR